MTTPPTPAGWYPDPEGTGGQRYWDGVTWTEHRTPAPVPPPAPQPPVAGSAPDQSSWPTELPPWPTDMEMPSWEKAASEPTSVIKRPDPVPAPEPEPEPETAAEPEEAAVEAPEPVVETPEPPAEPSPELEAATQIVKLPEPPTTVVPTYTPPAAFTPEPPSFPPADPFPPGPPAAFTDPGPSNAFPPGPSNPFPASPADPFPPSANGNLLKIYLGGIAALLIALVAVLVYAFVIHKPPTSQFTLPGSSSETSASESTEASSQPSETDSPSQTATPSAGEAVDGDVTFTQNGIEIGSTVTAPDNDFLTKTATGQFIVVHLTLTNAGQLPATFIAEQQVLTAGGQTYTPDTEATFYLGGTSTVIYPGEPVEVSIAFDVPAGTVPESLQVHGDINSPGAVLALS